MEHKKGASEKCCFFVHTRNEIVRIWHFSKWKPMPNYLHSFQRAFVGVSFSLAHTSILFINLNALKKVLKTSNNREKKINKESGVFFGSHWTLKWICCSFSLFYSRFFVSLWVCVSFQICHRAVFLCIHTACRAHVLLNIIFIIIIITFLSLFYGDIL